MIRPYFPVIDGVRFASAILVALFHFGFSNAPGHEFEGAPLVSAGWIGVEIFFVISGFVIANSAVGSTPTRFAVSRALRLYPATWICATASLILIAVQFGPSADLVLSFARTVALLPKAPAHWISAPYWTLGVEIIFYGVVFAALCLKQGHRLPQLALMLLVPSSIYNATATLYNFTPHNGTVWDLLLLRHGCFFALGIWIWKSSVTPIRSWERIAGVVAIISCLFEIENHTRAVLPSSEGSVLVLVAPTLLWVLAVAVITWSAHNPNLKTSSALRLAGLMTFPFYLVHHDLGIMIERKLLDAGISWSLAITIAIICNAGFAFAVCRWGEPAIRKALRPEVTPLRWSSIRPFSKRPRQGIAR